MRWSSSGLGRRVRFKVDLRRWTAAEVRLNLAAMNVVLLPRSSNASSFASSSGLQGLFSDGRRFGMVAIGESWVADTEAGTVRRENAND